MRKLCARWVSRLLTIDQKCIRVTTPEQNLAYFNRNLKEFLLQCVTMDDIWIHYYTLESREGSKQWIKPCESAAKRPKRQQSSGKVMANVFWDTHGVIFMDYLEKVRTITGAYYAALLDRFVDEIRKKRPHLKKKKSFFMMTIHHFTHHTLHTQKSMNWHGFKSLPHPLYFPDLSPATIICSQTSKDGCVIDVFSRTKKLNGKQKGILENLTNCIT